MNTYLDNLKWRYTSEVLSELLDASNITDATRSVMAEHMTGLPAKVMKAGYHFGGKMMAFPAYWALQKALGKTNEELLDIVRSSKVSFFFTISTSIGDDLADKEEGVGNTELFLFYFIFMQSMLSLFEKKGSKSDLMMKMYTCFGDGLTYILDEGEVPDLSNISALKLLESRSGSRVGDFHKMIAEEATMAMDDLSPECKEALVELCSQFGCWCIYIDDIIDIERDICSGIYITYPVVALLEHYEHLKSDIVSKNIIRLAPVLRSEEYSQMLSDVLRERLHKVIQYAEEKGFTEMAGSLKSVSVRLDEFVREIRVAAYERYIRNQFDINEQVNLVL